MSNETSVPSYSSLRSPLLWTALAGQLALLALLNHFDDWTLETNPILFVVTAVGSGALYFYAAAHFARTFSGRAQMIIFWGLAVAFRVAVLPLEPGDDLWRYQWEGRIQQEGFNPYLSPPDAQELQAERSAFEHWYRINHRDFPAIYPAGAQLTFKALAGVSQSALFFKVVFTIADLAAVALLLRLLGGETRYARTAWYAWNPLIVYSFAGGAHFDSLMLAPFVGGIWLIKMSIEERDPFRKWSWAISAAVVLGVAISIKLVPVLVLLACAFGLRLRAVTLLISLAIPLLLSTAYGFPQVRIFDPLGDFAYITRLNDLVWWVIEDTVWPNPRQKNYSYNVVTIVVVALVSVLWWRRWERGVLWSMGAALLLSPVLHPWYVTWILPWATWRRALPWHALSVSIFSYYLFFTERLFMLPWRSELWMRTLVIVPPLLALGLMFIKPAQQERGAREAA